MTCYRLDLEASGLTYPLPRKAKPPLFRYFDPGSVAVALLLYQDGTVIESRGPDIADTLACDRFLNNGGTFESGDWEIDVLTDAGYTLVPCDDSEATGYTGDYLAAYT